MKFAIFDAICKALNEADVRYLVAGGLAVNAHGYLRLTYDIDLVIQLDPKNILAAFDTMASLGYRPSVPVTGDQFADARQRKATQGLDQEQAHAGVEFSQQPKPTDASGCICY